MSFVKKAIKGVTNVIGGITGANAAARGAERASQFQVDAAERARQLLQPFIGAGTQALGSQQALLGLSGPEAQAAAIEALKLSPFFTSQLELGENRILQNASATGGLRGGNTQAALAQFSPQLLAQTIQQQLGNLGGLSGQGLNAAGAAGGLIQQQGAAQAGNALAQGARPGQIFGTIAQLAGTAIGAATGGPAGAQLGGQFGANLGGGTGGFSSGGGLLGGNGIGGGFITNPTANIGGPF